MTDAQLRRDELASAYLDGEATPAETAEIEQDDTLLARAEELRRVCDAVAAPVAAVPAELRDGAIATALAASERRTAAHGRANVIGIHRRRMTQLAAAAAVAILAAAVGAGWLTTRGANDSEQLAAEAPSFDAAEADDAAPADTESAAAGDSSGLAAPAESPDAEQMATDQLAAEEPLPTEESRADEGAMETTVEGRVELDDIAEDDTVTIETADQGDAAVIDIPDADDAAVVEMPDQGDTVVVETDGEDTVAAAITENAGVADTTAENAAVPAEDTASADEATFEPRTSDEAAYGVVDLGSFESLESLLSEIAAPGADAFTPTAATDPGAEASTPAAATDPGSCSAATRRHAFESGIETRWGFIASVNNGDEPLRIEGRVGEGGDGDPVVVYATEPDCMPVAYQADVSDGR